MILQIVTSVFVFLILWEAAQDFYKKILSLRHLVFWTLIWGMVLVVVWLPQATFILSRVLGITRGIDAVVDLSIVVIFYLVFRILTKIEKIEKEITQLVRKESLKNNK